ncbi:MAG: hypothetical protein K1W26_01590 [Acetatifactor sp.]
MKTKDVFLKTMKFVWLKLALGGIVLLFALVTLFPFVWLGSLGDGGGIVIALTVWFILVGCVYGFLQHYVGYILKAGHVAMVTTAVTTGSLPEDQLAAAREMVSQRFLTANVYFAVDRLVSGAVSQLQKGLQKVDDLLGKIPGVSFIVSFAQMFVHIALNYVDECCLGYTFLHGDQSAFKSAADGVVIYFQNWKKLLKDAAVMTLAVMVISFLAWLLPFLLFAGIFAALGIHLIFAALLSIIIAAILKSSFVDSFLMVRMMVSYMEVVPSTEITFDLYGKLCKLSDKFKSLFDRGQQEQQKYGNA